MTPQTTTHTATPWHVETPAGLNLSATPQRIETLWILQSGYRASPVVSWQIAHDLLSEYEIATIRANASLIVRAVNSHAQLVAALTQAVESSGFSLSGPTNPRAAEHGEPAWVCNARAVIAQTLNS
jgi:hypothetical protein